MKVGFFNVYNHTGRYEQTVHVVLADLMIRSVRATMPDVQIVHLTNETSPQIMGVDAVRRLPDKPAAVLCVEHYEACEGDWLLLDTDVIVQRDVRDVFEQTFDVAVCDRDGTLVEGEEDIQLIKDMPYNIGVLFSRSPAFWHRVGEKLATMTDKRKAWMGNQYAACQVIAEGEFAVRHLPGLQYNYAAHNTSDRCETAAIAHYKGPFRKKMMLSRFQEYA